METIFRFTLDLLSARAPGLAFIVLAAFALFLVSPLRLTLTIGDRSSRRQR